MSLLPSPATIRRTLGRGVAAVARRVLRITPEPVGELRRVPDDLPKDNLFSQPLVCEVRSEVESIDDGDRAVFTVLVRDALGKRCPDIAVEARVTGPERTATGQTTTGMFGTATFRMVGPAGAYAIAVTDVAAGGLAWDPDAGTTEATVTVG